MKYESQPAESDNPPFILVVDDKAKNLQLVGSLLEDQGYDIAFAKSGQRALELADQDPPDLILLDVMMPGMDGYEVCTKLKQNNALASIPVIFLTAKTETEDIVQAFESGGVDYVTKPFRTGELIARVATQLNLKQARERLKLSNEELSVRNEELKVLNKKKSEFMGIAAHDLKNPLVAIAGLSGVVKDMVEDGNDPNNRLDEEALEMVQGIEKASTHMFSIVNNLLNTEALESGHVQLHKEKCDLQKIVSEVVKLGREQVAGKKIELIVESTGETIVLADPGRLREVVDNLISNAIKFSPCEKRVWVNMSAGGEANNFIRCSVKDEGPGLKPDEMGKLFGKFQKLSARPTGGETSTGLGLSIVKQLIDLHNGRIWAESEYGRGCTFIFELPLSENTGRG